MTRNKRHKQPSRDYEVGYGKPPQATRFQKGQSGNLRGRPKGSRSMRDQLQDILQSKVALRGANGTRTVTLQEALLRKHIENALKGDARALLTIVRLADQDGQRADPEGAVEPDVLGPEDQALIDAFMARQARPRSDDEDA